MSRMWILPHLCERWGGPIVLAVYTPGAGDQAKALAYAKHNGCRKVDMLLVDQVEGADGPIRFVEGGWERSGARLGGAGGRRCAHSKSKGL
jgi:hypothetical protein